ncbi:hypothetical protein KUCAC02_008550 [Chaenocephalus aceratus]|uniref:Uncharacterized protein n=1 Tax=Chaenocephalus aceratus TaxID=36190 RepID=A0ACB9WSC8_CHAAC|nr:hypothetical protein KUCAC02_008550 [Chaenocephalus aceratus]
MLILPMETPAHMEMAQREILEQRTKGPAEEITEETFLKDLYLFMKKRDTPIERIPNLGFKQIDLFLMFKVVRAMGGYRQVMAQQLWKQVYNSLGGNPRSTSAATCTRRHYEKLLLPYECHLTGILVNVVPRNQPKHFHFTSEDSPRPDKRKLTSVPLHQNPPTLHSHPRESVFPLSPRYPPYHHPSHAVLPPYVPVSSPVLTLHSSPPPKPCPPSSSKTPKFLNKPSPLYTPRSLQVMINDGAETQDGEASFGDTSYPEKAREAYVNQKARTASGSPTAPTLRTDEGVSTMAQRSSSPKSEVTIRPKEEREASPEVRELDFTDLPPGLPRENGGKMEIEHSDILRRAASQGVFGQRDINKSSSSRPTHYWDAFDKETQAATLPVTIDLVPAQCSETMPPPYPFTTEEVQKLKKILSRSL